MHKYWIGLIKTPEEYRACAEIERALWGHSCVSSEVLLVTQESGGVVLGATVEGKMVGFLYAFLGRRHGRLIHWSHIMGVRDGYRDLGLGFRMKQAHRRLALQRGVRSICWTYDPLQSRNANLNIARLAARPEEYIPNRYGQFESHIEKGLPSDRFVVNWHIGTQEVARQLRARTPRAVDLDVPRANETRLNPHGFLENHRLHLHLRAPRLAVEIPPNTDAIRERDLALALRWRLEIRRIFTHYLAAGYQVVDFAPPRLGDGHCVYFLRRR
jgi:predicted GNAT superfamily acetyltransferase